MKVNSKPQVKYACAKSEWGNLLTKDQLKQEQGGKRAFAEFKEGPLTFMPTYKYDPGTDDWDSSEKGRAPAWCDRILWVAGNTEVGQTSYSSTPAIRISDHKPVYSLFHLKVKEVDESGRKKLYVEALKEGDRRANEALPQVQLCSLELPADEFMLNPLFDFGVVRFLEPVAQVMTVRNSGQFPVVFKFRRKPGDEAVSKPWLTVTPPSQRVRPGQEAQIHYQVLLDKHTVWALNKSGEHNMEDMLVLHLRYGRDFFISVRATYSPSCFGESLEAAFARSPKPDAANILLDLVDLALSPPRSRAGFQGPGKTAVEEDYDRQVRAAFEAGVPLPLWRLVNHIQTYGLQSADLFSQAGSHKDFSDIRHTLDNDKDWTTGDCGDGAWGRLPGGIHSVVEALLRMLDSLPEPVIPRTATEACLKMAAHGLSPHNAWTPIKTLPSVHRDTFTFLVSFLRLVTANAEHNSTDIDLISSVFASLVLGQETSEIGEGRREEELRRSRAEAASRFLAAALHVPAQPSAHPTAHPTANPTAHPHKQ